MPFRIARSGPRRDADAPLVSTMPCDASCGGTGLRRGTSDEMNILQLESGSPYKASLYEVSRLKAEIRSQALPARPASRHSSKI